MQLDTSMDFFIRWPNNSLSLSRYIDIFLKEKDDEPIGQLW